MQYPTHTPKTALKMFRKVLAEAAKFYGRAPQTITEGQFSYVGKGRLGRIWIERLGGFASVKRYCAPNKANPLDKKTIDMVKKLLAS